MRAAQLPTVATMHGCAAVPESGSPGNDIGLFRTYRGYHQALKDNAPFILPCTPFDPVKKALIVASLVD